MDLLAITFDLAELQQLIEATKSAPWVQGWWTAFATFFFENVVCWTIVPPLICTNILSLTVAFWSTFFGVFIGDILMYLPVRFAMRYVTRLKWVRKHQDQVEACAHLFDRHIGKTMFIIRFTPGIRTPALLAAGLLRINFAQYTLYSFLSCALQSAIVVYFMPTLFDPVIAWFGRLWEHHAWIVIAIIAIFFTAFCVAQVYIAKAVMRRITAHSQSPNPATPEAECPPQS